ncbi:MAG: dipeptide ABC transporter permease DppB [Bdellovibrionales bacterium CG12_big_fil_rev_8_21_14_0_65_38_15]|nr:MAG: dipeptide ABC transporter permease DppB [Bdellovibrionales bacterium CG22_combo_CG10-13_8_21_14_all_38_13]PIQ56178.1 MAG: dipeptide ABC transporter permease DppB [Bdellovibrionales bacterium CG12_big_fil_rev_8_21_14_0_65_38_15]PIR28805.1 MAG: dipeptide ABC transporter permease DppB [Bdellovibrionales bacterium CG11_big_fil_rev_8_21_14_0_20_38_13]
MLRFILGKLGDLVPTLIGISILSFVLVRFVPGDPVMLLLGERGADPAVYAQMKKDMGLDLPVWRQYINFATDAAQGDLGTSIISKRPVVKEFFDRFPATLELGVVALLFAIIIGIPLGIIAAVKRNSFYDYFLMGGSLLGYSMPIFWWGLVLILIFSVQLGWTPVSGRMSVMFYIEPWTGFMLIDTLTSEVRELDGLAPFWSALSHLILPAVAMGTIPLAVIARMTRSSMLEVLGEDYIRTAKAKGLSRYRTVAVHALRNALIPIVTIVGLMFGSIITGAILTETIFSWPGIGRWLVASINARDYPVIQGGVLFIATMIVIINVLVDLAYAVVNPKMRG